MKRQQVTDRITFEQCQNLVACPYCKAEIGKPCAGRYQGKPSSDPHPSRAHAAFEKRGKKR